ncbi:hypothetical protein VVDAL7940_02009 [Vibrio vulnificus]|nr:hypothetical protein VVDAL7940_02009 [Vibrio vulnificus]
MFRGQRSRNHLCSHNGWLPFTLAIDIGLQCVFKLIGDTNIVHNQTSGLILSFFDLRQNQ